MPQIIKNEPLTAARRRRREQMEAQVFTGVNLAVFLVLISCVAAAAMLWERWH